MSRNHGTKLRTWSVAAGPVELHPRWLFILETSDHKKCGFWMFAQSMLCGVHLISLGYETPFRCGRTHKSIWTLFHCRRRKKACHG